MECTITIKFGLFEVSCSGSEAFIEKTFPVALQTAKEVYLELGIKTPTKETLDKDTANGKHPATGVDNKTALAISTICAKLKVDSGPALAVAAVFCLERQGKTSCTRSEITAEMKKATAYFKGTYINNLSSSLKTLITSGKLLEQAKDIFALDAATSQAMESQLGLN